MNQFLKLLSYVGLIIVLAILLKGFNKAEIYSVNYFILSAASKLFLSILSIFFIITSKLQVRNFLYRHKLYSYAASAILVILSVLLVNSTIEKNDWDVSNTRHFFFFLMNLSTGIFEELLFRVFVFFSLFKLYRDKDANRPLIKTIILSSTIFALAHLSNLFNEEIIAFTVITQVVLAFGIGVFLQCVYLRNKNIITVIILHALINYLGSFKTRLGQIQNENNLTPLEWFYSLGMMIIFIFLIVIPLSYFLLKPVLKNKGELAFWAKGKA